VLIACMIELSVICQLNLANVLTRFLPSLRGGTARALLHAYGASGATALVVGVAFVFLVPLGSEEFAFLRDEWPIAASFVLAQIGWGWFVLQDAALTAMRRAPWVPVENAVFGILKVAALVPLVAVGAAHGVFLAWVLPVLLLLVPVNLFLFRTAIPEHLRRHQPGGSALEQLGRPRLVRFIAQDYGASVLAPAAVTALPLLVVALLGSAANAYFYIPFMIVVAFDMLFYGVCTSLVVEGALAEHRIRALAERVVRRFTLILVPGVALMIAAAPLILLPFGDDYVGESTPVLRLLACACLFRAALTLYTAIARLHGLGLRILAVEAAQMGLLLTAVAVLANPLGLIGVALAWVGSIVVVALAILPSLLRFFRSPPTTPVPGGVPSWEGVAIP
jgi:O-antigen/teichoic acid export membrane protein